MKDPITAPAAQLNKTQLLALLSISERTLENMVKARKFPPPVKVGKHVYWSEIAVRRWQERLFAFSRPESTSLIHPRCMRDIYGH